MAEIECARVFVEGESDKIILQRAIEIFFPNKKELVKIETKESGAGHSYVIDMLVGWRSHHKHHPHLPRAAGIVDSDASKYKNEFNQQPENIRSAKCFSYPQPQGFHPFLHKGFKIPVTLESLYPKEIWLEALNKGSLAPRDKSQVYPRDLINQIVNGEANLSDEIDKAWEIYVNYDLSNDSKIKTARALSRKNDSECKELLISFRDLSKNILEYLGV